MTFCGPTTFSGARGMPKVANTDLAMSNCT